MRVLVVDNESHSAEMLARQLRLQGFSVESATGYAQVEQRFSQGASLEAIVTDWNLGHGHPSGVEVLKLARDRCPQAKRVLISGSMVEQLDPVVSAFVQKPFRVAQILTVLRDPTAE